MTAPKDTLTTVAWCLSCRTYRPAGEVGRTCDCEPQTPLIEKAGRICERCELMDIFFSAEEFARDQERHDEEEFGDMTW